MISSESKSVVSKYYGVFIVLTVLLYVAIQSFAIRAPFFGIDDVDELDHVRKCGFGFGLLGADVFSFARPVKNIVFYVFSLFGFDGAFSCRMIAVGIGVFSFFAVLRYLRKVFADEGWALAAAALWMLAPTQVSCTAWLSCVNIQLMVAFFCCALSCYDDYAEAGSMRRFAASMAFGVLAVFSYESAVVLPAVLFIADVYFHPDRLRRRSSWTAYVSYSLIVAVYMVLHFVFLTSSKISCCQNFHPGTTRVDLMLGSAWIMFQHLYSWFVPFGRMAALGYYPSQTISTFAVAVAWLLPVCLVAAIACLFRRERLVSFGLAMFVLSYLPVSNVLGFGNGPYGDYYLAVPGIGLAIAYVAVVRAFGRSRRVLPFAGVLLLVGLRVAALPESAVWAYKWADEERAYASSLEVFPDSLLLKGYLQSTRYLRGDLGGVPEEIERYIAECKRFGETPEGGYKLMTMYYGFVLGDAQRAFAAADDFYCSARKPEEEKPWYHYIRGCIYEDVLGDSASAGKEYLLAVSCAKEKRVSATYLDRAARWVAIDGNVPYAIALWEKAVELDSTCASASANLEIARRSVAK